VPKTSDATSTIASRRASPVALVVTVCASLMSPKGRAQNAVANARRHAKQYLDLSYEADQQLREKTFDALQREEKIIRGLREKYRPRIRDEHDLMDLLRRARAVRDRRVAAGYGSAAARANGSS
jgi:tellurite resistance protein TerC